MDASFGKKIGEDTQFVYAVLYGPRHIWSEGVIFRYSVRDLYGIFLRNVELL